MLVNVVKCNDINNLDMFSIAGKIAKHVEEIGIKLKFSDSFKIEDIPNKVVINLLDNI